VSFATSGLIVNNLRVRIKRDMNTTDYIQEMIKSGELEFENCDEAYLVIAGDEWIHAIDYGDRIEIKDSWLPRMTLREEHIERE